MNNNENYNSWFDNLEQMKEDAIKGRDSVKISKLEFEKIIT